VAFEREAIEQLKGLMRRLPLVVAPIARHRVIDIDDGRDEAELADVFLSTPMRISGSVDSLMVLKRRLDVRITQAGGTGQNFNAPEHVLLHDFHFMGLKAPGLIEDVERDLHFADVVQQRPHPG